MGILSNLNPAPVFKYFEDICSIPHGSGNTKAISDFCADFALKHNLRYIQDKNNNIIIFKDGTASYEHSAPVILQGHLDMVCEKEADCDINFEKEGLRLQLENGIISAKGTTLGGDDGIAIAYALAILASDDIPHPPLEAVFTVDEEIGMLGASALDCSPLKARIMLNIDSEEEGYLLVSCAGGATATAHLPITTADTNGKIFTLKVTGLIGGHSGVEIDKGRANSNLIMGRTLYYLSENFDFNLISIQGGLKDNAIARETTACLVFSDTTNTDELKKSIINLNKIYSDEYKLTDADIKLELTENNKTTCNAMDNNTTKKAISVLYCMPNGIQKMSKDIEGLVQTSLNLGILKTTDTEIIYNYSLRSSVSTEKEELLKRIKCFIENVGGFMTYTGDYPAWEYRQDSPLRETMIKVYEKQHGKKPVIQALHAGLECGIFADKLDGLDCVSYGPDIQYIHTPKESMDVESVQRTWEYTLEILKNLK